MGIMSGAFARGTRDTFEQLLAQRMMQQKMQEAQQQQQFENQMRERTFQSNDELKRATLDMTAQTRADAAADRQARLAGDIANTVPGGSFVAEDNPMVGMLRSGGYGSLLSATPERPQVEVGPLQQGDTGEARPRGFLKAASAMQLRDEALRADREADNARLNTQMTETERHNREMEKKGAGRDGMTFGQQFQATSRLQRDYEKVRAPQREMTRQLRLMKSGLDQAKKGNLNAGSQQILVTFQKILDPTSVVRESEYARSPEGQAFLRRIEGFGQRMTQGGPGVTLPELEQFVTAAEDMVNSQKGFGASKRKQLERTAIAYQLDPSLVFDEDDEETPGPAAPAAAAPPTAAPKRLRYDSSGRPIKD